MISRYAFRSGYMPWILIAVATLNGAGTALAAGWNPQKNVEIVVGTAPGSGVDRPARIIQKIFEDEHIVGVTTTVVNKPGAGGAIAYGYVAQKTDGTCLVVAAPTLLTNYIAGKSTISFTDLTPVALLASEYVAFVVQRNSPITSARDLANVLKQDPSKLSVGIGTSVGNNNHIALAQFARKVGANVGKLKTVVFKSPGEVMTALLGRHLDMAVLAASNIVAQLQKQNGDIRVIGLAAPARAQGALADVPTLKEQGIDVVTRQWRAVMGPKAMSAGQIAYWDEAFGRLVATAAWRKYLAGTANESTYMNGEETGKFLEAENEVLKGTLEAIGLAKSQ